MAARTHASSNGLSGTGTASSQRNTIAAGQEDQHPFYKQVVSLSDHVLLYGRPGLLDKALDTVDLTTIYEEADVNSERETELGYQDHVIRALMRWFKQDFFQWVNSPNCSICNSATDGIGTGHANAAEAAAGADRVELYQCRQDSAHVERFPRYNNPETLLKWRKGRCGEFANCFTLLCIALGSRARWIWNAEDHVWTEVFSERLQRWVHCDPCENAWDSPQIYAVGWGKKMSYCLGFSTSGAQDVTRRYVRKEEHAKPRSAPEAILQRAIEHVNQKFRQGISPTELEQYRKEDREEELELSMYNARTEATKAAEEQPRESGSASWVRERREDGGLGK